MSTSGLKDMFLTELTARVSFDERATEKKMVAYFIVYEHCPAEEPIQLTPWHPSSRELKATTRNGIEVDNDQGDRRWPSLIEQMRNAGYIVE